MKREKRKEKSYSLKIKTFIFSLSFLSLLFSLFSLSSCTKTVATAKPMALPAYKQTFAATPNEIYYALRWALKAYDYPIAEEDLNNGIIKSRYVPVKATSHYVDLFGHQDFGVSGAYHQLEVKLVPKNGHTEVQIDSRVQAVVKNIKSTGQEEELILTKVEDYLRSANTSVTNLGVQE